MTRILADLPDEDIKWRDQLAAGRGKSQGAILSIIARWYREHIEDRK